MELAARLDDYGKPAWIAIMVLGFIIFWPIGLAILAYLIWSGRMGCWRRGGPGRWHYTKEAREEWRARRRNARRHGYAPSGNTAFDEYREETLRRLQEEQDEFQSFLDRLRHAKDKAEFDQFMDERRTRADEPDEDDGDGGEPDHPNGPGFPRAPSSELGGGPSAQPAG